MIYLLDSNILMFLIKNQPPAIAHRVNTLPEDSRLCMSFITWAELLKGAERSTRKPEVLRRLDALAEDATLVTNNTREFQRVAGLSLENWVPSV